MSNIKSSKEQISSSADQPEFPIQQTKLYTVGIGGQNVETTDPSLEDTPEIEIQAPPVSKNGLDGDLDYQFM